MPNLDIPNFVMGQQNISHDEFVLINNVMKEFYDIMEEIKKSNDNEKFKLYVKNSVVLLFKV